MQLTRPHLYPLLYWRRWYAHSMPRLPFPLQPLLLSLQIRLPSGFPLFDPVRALLQHGAPLENGLFTFGKTDCTAGFAVGFFGLFESLGTVGKGRGGHCRCCRGRSGGTADCGGPCVVLRYVSFERNRSPEARLGLAWIVGKHGLREPIKFFCFVFFLFFSFFKF